MTPGARVVRAGTVHIHACAASLLAHEAMGPKTSKRSRVRPETSRAGVCSAAPPSGRPEAVTARARPIRAPRGRTARLVPEGYHAAPPTPSRAASHRDEPRRRCIRGSGPSGAAGAIGVVAGRGCSTRPRLGCGRLRRHRTVGRQDDPHEAWRSGVPLAPFPHAAGDVVPEGCRRACCARSRCRATSRTCSGAPIGATWRDRPNTSTLPRAGRRPSMPGRGGGGGTDRAPKGTGPPSGAARADTRRECLPSPCCKRHSSAWSRD